MWWGSNGSIAWAITNNMASTRDMYVEQIDPRDPRRYRDGDTWREFDERRVEHQGARRGDARADHPLHGARSGGQRAGAVARCRRRSAAVAALDRHGAHGRHPRLHRHNARARLGRFPRGVARLVGRDIQLRLCRCARPYRLSDGGPHPDPRSCRAGLPRCQRSGGSVAGHHSVRRPAAYVRPAQRLRRQRQPAHRAGRLEASDLWRLFAGPSRRAAGPGAGRTRRDGRRCQHPLAERREELPRRTFVPAHPAASRRRGSRRSVACSPTGIIAIH